MKILIILSLILNSFLISNTINIETKNKGEQKHFANNIFTFQANFKQIIYGERGASKVIYQGNIIANNKNKARWIYLKPTQKEVYINDGLIQIYEPLLKEVTIIKANNELDFLSLLKQLKQTGEFTYKATIDNILYTLTFKNNLPFMLEYKDSLDNKINIMLSDIRINEKIIESNFVLEIPSDADILQAN